MSAPSAGPRSGLSRNNLSPDIAEAERLAGLAFDAYRRKDYERALALYEQALGAARSADILYNMARVYDVGLHDSLHAIEYYRLYLAEPKAQPPRSEFAERRITELQPAPEPVVTTIPQDTSAERTREDAATARPSVVAPASIWTWRETTAAVLAGSGVVALGVGIGFGVSAYAQSDDWRDECDGNACRSQHAVDAAHTAARRARVATVALAAGGGLLAGGAAVWWFGSKQDAQAGHVALQLAPTGGGGAEVGCSLSGSF